MGLRTSFKSFNAASSTRDKYLSVSETDLRISQEICFLRKLNDLVFNAPEHCGFVYKKRGCFSIAWGSEFQKTSLDNRKGTAEADAARNGQPRNEKFCFQSMGRDSCEKPQ